MRPPIVARVALLLTAASLAACGEAPEPALEQQRFDVIGGVPIASAALDHTGALLYRVRASGETGLLCSASLIGPETLVTARHCIAPLPTFERIGIDVAFARGVDFNAPDELVGIAAFAGSPVSEGGALGYGNDVAVIHLERPLAAAPIRVMPFDPALLGEPLLNVGYGVSTPDGLVDGLRRVGRETVVAVSGRIYEAFFGDFESFVEWRMTGETSDSDWVAILELLPFLGDLTSFALEWESWRLLDGYELATGGLPGDTQSCTGDSGGPLGRIAADGVFESFGVVSGGPSSLSSVCDYGQIFATFGPASYPFVSAAAAWTDPCGELDARGACSGDTVQRCLTSFAAGVRELASEDCSAAALRCVEAEGGALCVP